jgi:hypothetical protein
MSSKRNPGPEYPDLIELAEWHEANIASLKIYKERVFEATVNPSLTILSKFRGLQDEEIHETFDLIEDEVKKLFLFSILSVTEGNIRKDFFDRINDAANKDTVSKKYRKLYDKAGSPEKARVIKLQSLLDIWKLTFTAQKTKDKIGQYKTNLHFRHWMAHGRYYPLGFHANYEPRKIARECEEIIRMIAQTKI